jgi:hypothetical protein
MTRPGGQSRPQGVRALLWLKSREWLGDSRDSSRLWLLGLLLFGWFALIITGCFRLEMRGDISPRRDLLFVAAAAWPLWAVIPLLGGGGGEVVAAHRLAPYPVSPRAVFGGAWLTGLLDVPYLVVLPLVLALSTVYAGAAGLVLALAFAAGASAIGQLLAWVSFLALSGRKRSGLTALLLTASVVGLLGALPRLLPDALDLAEVLPGGWLRDADQHWIAGEHAAALGLAAALVAPVFLALVVGPHLTAAALDREARSGGVGARPWGAVTWVARGSVVRALVVANVRSISRAVGAQVALAGVLAVPTITRLPGLEVAAVTLIAMGGVAGIAAATVLGVNSFAFDAGGASALLTWPVRLRDVILAKAIAVGGSLLAGQWAVTLLGAVVTGATATQVVRALVLCVARTALLTALALIWSVRLPSPSDYDSLRARISSPGSIVTFALAAAFATYFVSQSAHNLRGVTGTLAVLLMCGAACVVGLMYATRELADGGVERIATAVHG